MKKESIETLAVHAGEDRSSNFGALSTPIYPSTVFAFPDADEAAAIHNEMKPGYYYGRLGNPTTEALEKAIAVLEGAERGLAFASGMAAISGTVLAFVSAGDHIVAPESMYSTTTNFFRHISEKFGISVDYIDAGNAANYEKAIRRETKILWVETPSNPLLNIVDLKAVAKAAKQAGALAIADNTFATPYNQRPLDHGIDITLHSATKYLGGHSDLTAGLIAASSHLVEQIRHSATKLYGGNIAPQVAWLVLRGIKTLALRMERHNSNAMTLAARLGEDPRVRQVFYPGLANHPNNEVAAAQMSGFGGMVSFDLGSEKAGRAFINKTKLCALATSLGGVESIVQHSASMTHAAIPAEARAKAGIRDGLIRMSVGIENIDDICSDVFNALGQ